jgi:hypothetical protein
MLDYLMVQQNCLKAKRELHKQSKRWDTSGASGQKKDRRKILIRRTEKDRALEGKYVEVPQQMTKLYYKGFTKNEIDRFERDLARILNNLAKFEDDRE